MPTGGGSTDEKSTAAAAAKQNRVFADLVGVAGGAGYHDARARRESLLGAGAADRRVLADLVAAPGGGRATTYVHEEIPYLGAGQRTGERLQI